MCVYLHTRAWGGFVGSILSFDRRGCGQQPGEEASNVPLGVRSRHGLPGLVPCSAGVLPPQLCRLLGYLLPLPLHHQG